MNDIILKCLKKRPEERYRNFKDLKDALLKYYPYPTELAEIETPSPNFKTLEAEYFVNKGISMTTLGRYHEAIAFFDLALETDSNFIEALSRKGIALIGLGKYYEAFEYFDRYLKINPRDAEVLNHKGSLLNLQGKREDSLKYFKKALDINPWCNEVLYNKAVTLFTMGRYEEAYESLDKIEEDSIGKSESILREICLQKMDLNLSKDSEDNYNRGITKKS